MSGTHFKQLSFIQKQEKLEIVTSFKYLGSVIADEGSKPEILSRIAQATAALTRSKPVWIDRVFLSAPRYN